MAGITLKRVVSIQLSEGATDSSVFENFLYQTLLSLRSEEANKAKHIEVLMDNATIHRHSKVLETAKRMHASVPSTRPGSTRSSCSSITSSASSATVLPVPASKSPAAVTL